MADPIRSFFASRMQVGGSEPNGHAQSADSDDEVRKRVHIAACALLLELAWADDEFSNAEREHIEAVVRRHLGLDDEAARMLLDLADEERRNARDVYQFTSLIRDSYDLGQKTLLAEIMWGVILADGQIQRHEGRVLRKIASLLDLEPGYLAQARLRARSDEH
ncbi:MAG: TerB family tellurite resistance protein [Gemmatimonadetes bacterium]|nr:TerB family tellurite resistance protein [Gemmatimonadota bacterium]